MEFLLLILLIFLFVKAFESHKIDEIALKIVSMQQSLVVLKNSNDSEDKKLQLEGFKNRLEAIVSPHLLKAFTSSNIGKYELLWSF